MSQVNCQPVIEGDRWRCPVCTFSRPITPGHDPAKIQRPCVPPRIRQSGPGTELKNLLAKIAIRSKCGCQCDHRAAVMDINGCDWCEANIETIVGWMREEAARRKWPFIAKLARRLVKTAIARARQLGEAAAPDSLSSMLRS